MHGGYGRQGMGNFFPQSMTRMPNFGSHTQMNMSGRSAWHGSGQQYVQQSIQRHMQPQNPNNVGRNNQGARNNPNGGLQSRLGPAQNNKSEANNVSKPVLMRPGQDKSNKQENKPTPTKTADTTKAPVVASTSAASANKPSDAKTMATVIATSTTTTTTAAGKKQPITFNKEDVEKTTTPNTKLPQSTKFSQGNKFNPGNKFSPSNKDLQDKNQNSTPVSISATTPASNNPKPGNNQDASNIRPLLSIPTSLNNQPKNTSPNRVASGNVNNRLSQRLSSAPQNTNDNDNANANNQNGMQNQKFNQNQGIANRQNQRFGNQGGANNRDSANDKKPTYNNNQSFGNRNQQQHGRGPSQDNRSRQSMAGQGNTIDGNKNVGAKQGQGRKELPRRIGGGYNQDKFWDRLQELSGPQYDLEPLDMSEKKFNAHSRLFVGSLTREVALEELKEMFSKHGELGQVYFNKEGGYAFINFDFHNNAEKAMRELNGTVLKGRNIKVRFAAITTGVRVRNLPPTVTNELLHKAFSPFGTVETCRVSVDDRGKPTGDGTVIFTEKKSAVMAFKKCQEHAYFITSQLRPVIVEPWETKDDEEGYPEASIQKNEAYKRDRKMGPRFAELNSAESDYAKHWKQLFDIYKEKKLSLESDLKAEMEALEVKMQLVAHQQETEKLRKELAQREQEARQLEMGLGMYGETLRPSTQLTDEAVYASRSPMAGMKRPHDYYQEDARAATSYDHDRYGYDSYYRSGYDEQHGYDRTYDSYSHARDTETATASRTAAVAAVTESTAVPKTSTDRVTGTHASYDTTGAYETTTTTEDYDRTAATDLYSRGNTSQGHYDTAASSSGYDVPMKRGRY